MLIASAEAVAAQEASMLSAMRGNVGMVAVISGKLSRSISKPASIGGRMCRISERRLPGSITIWGAKAGSGRRGES